MSPVYHYVTSPQGTVHLVTEANAVTKDQPPALCGRVTHSGWRFGDETVFCFQVTCESCKRRSGH